MTKNQIAFRANGLYEEIVSQAVEGLDIQATIFPQGEEVTRAQVRPLGTGIRSYTTMTDYTIGKHFDPNPFGTLDRIISDAYRESLGAVTVSELVSKLLSLVAGQFPPSKVWLVRQNISDHSPKKPGGDGYEDWRNNGGLDFYTQLIKQVTGMAPEIVSGAFLEAASTEWIVIDRHATDRVLITGGVVLTVPSENLAIDVAALGLFGKEESKTWKQAAVQKLREKLSK